MKKKIIALFLLICMIITLAGCAPEQNAEKYVELQRYDDFQFEKAMLEPDEAEVEAYVWNELYEFIEFNIIEEGAVKEEAALNVDFEVFVDGESLEGLVEGYEFVVGSGMFVDNVDTNLIGKNVGETVTFNFTFPKDYGDELVDGKDAEITFTINHMIDIIYPELTDEFMQENTEYATADELYTTVREYIERENTSDIVWKRVMDTATVKKYPKSMVKRYVDEQIGMYEEAAAKQGLTFEEMLEQYYGYTEKEFRKAVEERILESVKEELVIRAIAQKEDIVFTEEEIAEEIRIGAENYGFATPEEFINSYGENSVRNSIMLRKVLDYIISTIEFF
ncbi:MAG: hypothetical protein E7487_00055 [Ruminococcaceae bacterium]|nr:hypothetical protein [Oscillospiraceae bacterium]